MKIHLSLLLFKHFVLVLDYVTHHVRSDVHKSPIQTVRPISFICKVCILSFLGIFVQVIVPSSLVTIHRCIHLPVHSLVSNPVGATVWYHIFLIDCLLKDLFPWYRLKVRCSLQVNLLLIEEAQIKGIVKMSSLSLCTAFLILV